MPESLVDGHCSEKWRIFWIINGDQHIAVLHESALCFAGPMHAPSGLRRLTRKNQHDSSFRDSARGARRRER
jgi:hypothetical protein